MPFLICSGPKSLIFVIIILVNFNPYDSVFGESVHLSNILECILVIIGYVKYKVVWLLSVHNEHQYHDHDDSMCV